MYGSISIRFDEPDSDYIVNAFKNNVIISVMGLYGNVVKRVSYHPSSRYNKAFILLDLEPTTVISYLTMAIRNRFTDTIHFNVRIYTVEGRAVKYYIDEIPAHRGYIHSNIRFY